MRILPIIYALTTIIVFSQCSRKSTDLQLDDTVKSLQESSTLSPLAYLGQRKPSTSPELFAPDIISKPDRYEFGCTFSADGEELFFGVDNDGVMEIHHTKFENGLWTNQKKLFQNDKFSHNDPMYSPDEKKLFFISDRSMEPSGEAKDVDIWYIDLLNDTWSDPINAGPVINSALDEYFVSFADNGTMYYSSKDKSKDAPRYAFDIYSSEYKDETFLTPKKLPETINTDRYEADVFVAPDESYLIFCAIWKDGLGRGDLYISFKDSAGKWTQAQNMGTAINSENHELCPFVSRDGKYFFYTSNQDIYWVSTEIFEDFR